MTAVALVRGLQPAVGRHRAVLLGLAASVTVVALVWLASVPTGADTAAATVGPGTRLAATVPVDDVEVLLVARGGALSVHVAYPSPKGWLSVQLPAAPSTAVAAWAATEGTGPIPSLSVVYGRAPAPGAAVVIRWADGADTMVRAASDGVYAAARDDRVASEHVRIVDASGAPVLEIDGP